MTRFRPSRALTGLPVRLRVGDTTTALSAFVCADCDRIRFTADVDGGEAAGECAVCGGATVDARPGTDSEDLLLRDAGSGTRYGLRGEACADCGAVELRAAGVGSGEGTDCPACGGGMCLTEPILGASAVRFVDNSAGTSLEPRDRIDPAAWACADCGLVLFYGRTGG